MYLRWNTGERLHTLKGIDTELGEIFKELDGICVLDTNRCFKPLTSVEENDFLS